MPPALMCVVRLRAARVRAVGQRGSVSLEMVVVMPALLLLIFVGVQGALVYQARTVCLGAAQSGARAAAAEDGSAGAGIATARAALDGSGAGLGGAQVAGTRRGRRPRSACAPRSSPWCRAGSR